MYKNEKRTTWRGCIMKDAEGRYGQKQGMNVQDAPRKKGRQV